LNHSCLQVNVFRISAIWIVFVYAGNFDLLTRVERHWLEESTKSLRKTVF